MANNNYFSSLIINYGISYESARDDMGHDVYNIINENFENLLYLEEGINLIDDYFEACLSLFTEATDSEIQSALNKLNTAKNAWKNASNDYKLIDKQFKILLRVQHGSRLSADEKNIIRSCKFISDLDGGVDSSKWSTINRAAKEKEEKAFKVYIDAKSVYEGLVPAKERMKTKINDIAKSSKDMVNAVSNKVKSLSSKATVIKESVRMEREIEMDTSNIVDDMFFDFFGESSNEDNIQVVPDEIEPIVKKIESKGYKVKYASPGHDNTTFKNDANKDGVINGKFASTARVVFAKNYKFTNTPKGWEWKVLENGAKALYVKQHYYNEENGSKAQEFKTWKSQYMQALRSWASSLPTLGSDKINKDDTPDEEFSAS